MPDNTGSSEELGTLKYFKTGIPGLRGILCDKEGFAYYHGRGLNIVLFGPAGSGKTIFALQCAMGAIAEGKHVVFLSKDTSPITLLQRLNMTFRCFGLIKSPPQEANNIPPKVVPKDEKESEQKIDWTEAISLVPDDISSRIFTARLAGKDTELKWRVVLLDLLAERMELQKVVVENPKEGQRSIFEVIEAEPIVPIMSFGSLGLLNAGEFDRYATNESIFEGLARLCPRLRPVFEAFNVKVKNDKAKATVWDRWRNDLFVVCDSLPLSVLEDCLRSQTEGPAAAVPQKRQGLGHSTTRALTLFAMESAEMPDPMTAAFPPDIQIKLGFREEPYGMKTRTIQVLKARFQEIHYEPFPFVIHGQEEENPANVQIAAQESAAESQESNKDKQEQDLPVKTEADAFSLSHTVDLFWLAQDGKKETLSNPEKDTVSSKDKGIAKYTGKLRYPRFALRKPGITIFPSLPSVVHSTESQAPYEERRYIMFGSKSIDALTTEGRLAGGGTTLVVTENRCNSTVLALHFLLGEFGASCGLYTKNRHFTAETSGKARPASHQDGNTSTRRTPKSCLYIALENDLIGVLHNIWRYPLLRAAVFQETEGYIKDPSKNWERIETAVVSGRQQMNQPGKHHLYRIPLNPALANDEPCSVSKEDIYRAHLYILIPDLVWCTTEELLNDLCALFDDTRHHNAFPVDSCRQCLGISRIVLNRVSRVSANWPLIQEPTLLVTNLARLCSVRNINLMVIDDTAVQSETTGHIDSRWQNTARNIIRLRRVPLHGTEVVGMEIIRAGGTNVRALRPMELRSVSTRGSFSSPITAQFELLVADTFRGYTGIFSGRPQRCKTTVDLTYDHKNSPLHHDGLNMKRNLEGIMENVTVNVLGPKERPGVNSALSNLSDVSHDTCHVVSIDEIWLPRLIHEGKEIPALVSFSQDELMSILPEHITAKIHDELRKTKNDAGNNSETNSHSEKYPIAKSSLKLVGKYYVTQALMVASRNVRARDTKTELEPFYAIPFRHNWGVLAVLEAIPGCIQITQSKNLVPSEELEDFTKGSEYVRKFLDNPRQVSVPRWEDIVAFRLLNTCEQISQKDSPAQGSVHVFDFQRETADSVVSFFLELLLSTYKIDSIFCPVRRCRLLMDEKEFSDKTGLLFFATRDWEKWDGEKFVFQDSDSQGDKSLENMFKYVLYLMYHLIDEKQRYEIACKEQVQDPRLHTFRVEDDGIPKLRTNWHADEEDTSKLALISRQWLTTVPQGKLPAYNTEKDNDISIVLRELPVSFKVNNEPILFESIFFQPTSKQSLTELQNTDDDLKTKCMHENKVSYGVTLSGTWYLGTMSGGNRELATDIIRELVSEYHEMDRFLSGCGAPVSTRFYEDNFWLSSVHEHIQNNETKIPYADIIEELVNTKNENLRECFRLSEIVFPFSRTRIQNYVMISLVINTMIKQTMRLKPEEVKNPNSKKRLDDNGPLDLLVRYAVKRIDDIHLNSLYEEGPK